MQFTITVDGQCLGGGHVHITLTSGVKSMPLTIAKSDLVIDWSDPEEIKEVVLHLIRSRIKEDGATTPATIKASIESRPFYI